MEVGWGLLISNINQPGNQSHTKILFQKIGSGGKTTHSGPWLWWLTAPKERPKRKGEDPNREKKQQQPKKKQEKKKDKKLGEET